MSLFAKPFYQVPLDTQIKQHGGAGYNTAVKSTPVIGSYSFNYEFYTDTGIKILTSVNQFQIGLIHPDENGPYLIIHDADKAQYLMVCVNSVPGCSNENLINETLLGDSYDAAISTLRSWYPNYTNWNLNKPKLN